MLTAAVMTTASIIVLLTDCCDCGAWLIMAVGAALRPVQEKTSVSGVRSFARAEGLWAVSLVVP